MGRRTGEEHYGNAPPSVVADSTPDTRTPEKIAEDEDRAAEAKKEAGRERVRERGEAEPPTPRADSTPQPHCSLSIPGTKQRVPVFPTEDGMGEFAKAAATGDAPGMQAAIVGNHGYYVPSQTGCAWLHVGLLGSTSIRITEGAHLGEAGWVPTEWASGQ